MQLVILLGLLGTVFAQIGDLNCTDGTNYLPSAFNCPNVQDDAVCTALFPTALTVGTNTDRDANCYTTAAPAISQPFKDNAIASCPKTCGYCCQTPEFSCTNPTPSPLVCSNVVQAQCRDPQWRTQIAQYCPNVCGFCLLGGCVDAVSYCASQQSICFTSDPSLLAFANANCARTCNRCSSTTTASSVNSATCADTNANCANWVKNGFCSSTFYTAAQKQQYCGRSCGCTGK